MVIDVGQAQSLFIDKDEFVLPMLPPGGSMDDIIVKVGD